MSAQQPQEEPAFVAETLAWCNERRAEKGDAPLDRLPKGTPLDGYSCPCGAACGFYVGSSYWGKNKKAVLYGDAYSRTILPIAVSKFVYALDEGQLPQYEL